MILVTSLHGEKIVYFFLLLLLLWLHGHLALVPNFRPHVKKKWSERDSKTHAGRHSMSGAKAFSTTARASLICGLLSVDLIIQLGGNQLRG